MSPTKLANSAGKTEDPFADFRNFVYYLFIEVRNWNYVGDIQYDIADFMQNLPRGRDGIARGQVQSLRGAGKTELAVALALHRLYMNPDTRILVISSVLLKAQEFVALARDLIDKAPLIRHLKPLQSKDGLVEKDQKDNLRGFIVGAAKDQISKELSLGSYPVFGTYTGSHPDLIIADDIETPENSLTVGKREKLLSKIYEFEHLINPGGTILVLGTPQSFDSVYKKIGGQGYQIRRWPARLPSLEDQSGCLNVSPTLLEWVRSGKRKAGDPSYPERFGEDQLMMKESIYGPTMFALQMMLDPNLADVDRYPLKLRDLIVMDLHPELAPESVMWGTTNPMTHLDSQGLAGDGYFGPVYKAEKYAPYQSSVMFIDPKGKGADTVGYAVVKALNGILYVCESGGVAKGKGQDGTSEPVMEKLARIALKHKIKRVAVEDNFGDGMYSRLLAPIMARINGATEIKNVHSTGQKELRIIDTLEPLVAVHKLVIDSTVAKNDELMYQYCFITRAKGSLKHEDLVEALAGACNELKDLVAIDPLKAEGLAKKREQSAMVAAWARDAWGFALGNPPPAPERHNHKGWGRSPRKWRR